MNALAEAVLMDQKLDERLVSVSKSLNASWKARWYLDLVVSKAHETDMDYTSSALLNAAATVAVKMEG